jgi:Tol biopolymer transport system component
MPPDDPRIEVPVPFPASGPVEAENNLQRLTDSTATDTNARWSPDGKRIAWISDRSGSFQVWVMASNGSEKQMVSREPGLHGWPQWSPDGKKLVFWGYNPQNGRSSVSVAVPGDQRIRTLVTSQEALDRPTWSPDGKLVAYAVQTEGNWYIWVADVEDSRRYRLTRDAQMETKPLWSPDGTVIAYKVAPDKEYNLTIENFVSLANGLDKPTYRIWDGVKSIQMNDWSPDGTSIVYTAEGVTAASGEDRVSYLAVVNEVSLTGSRTAGSPILLSAGHTLGDRGPVFSPNGKQIAFWSWDKNYRATLWVAESDGSSCKQLTHRGFDMTPQWHPDGRSLLFESSRGGSLTSGP